MDHNRAEHSLDACLKRLTKHDLSPLELLPDGSLAEKMIGLVLSGPPVGSSDRLVNLFQELVTQMSEVDTGSLKVVVFGGGTGLSNIIGGDSRRSDWPQAPFTGLKEIFPNISSIVCVTDDGGSSGELLKDLPLIALGDLRHVLLSSIRKERLRVSYGLNYNDAQHVVEQLHAIFNYRFTQWTGSGDELLADTGMDPLRLPGELLDFIRRLTARLFSDQRLLPTLNRSHCLGNLLLAASIFEYLDPDRSPERSDADDQAVDYAVIQGLEDLSSRIGVHPFAVLPCTATSAQLQILYENGVLVTGEYKSGHARRGYPVDRALVEFFREPVALPEVEQVIQEADLIIFAPGSLYSSVVPILQVPGIAENIRANDKAFKLLIANIWVQKGETDAARDAPERKFHVSDLIRAYERNIPGGVKGLFSHILTLGLGDIPGSVLQNYALENKEPIYLDRHTLREAGFEPVESCIFSKDLLRRRRIIQHDPASLALAIRTLSVLQGHGALDRRPLSGHVFVNKRISPRVRDDDIPPCERYRDIRRRLGAFVTRQTADRGDADQSMPEFERRLLLDAVAEVIWHHPDIPPDHLNSVLGIILVDPSSWHRCQQWDNIFSFYDPLDGLIKIRRDQAEDPLCFEMAFLVALGESLLGNYAEEKSMQDVCEKGEKIGRIFRLRIRIPRDQVCFLRAEELDTYLRLARMRPSVVNPLLYTRLVNNEEGFTPPGLFFGLFYTWYLDNRFAAYMEYKMSIMRNEVSNLIPEQIRIVKRRKGLIRFFRETVFGHRVPKQAL